MTRTLLCLILLFCASPASAEPFSLAAVAEVKGLRRGPSDFCLLGHKLFVVTTGKSELLIADVRDPENPVELFKHYYRRQRFHRLTVDPNGILYASGAAGLTIFDVRRPERTKVLGTYNRLSYADGSGTRDVQQSAGHLVWRKDRLYIGSVGRRLLVVDVSNPAKPVLAGDVEFPLGLPGGVQHLSGTRFLVDHGNGVSVLDLADPKRAKPLAPGQPGFVFVEGVGEGQLHDLVATSEKRYVFASGPGPILYTLDLEEGRVVKALSLAKALEGTELFSLGLSTDERVLFAAVGSGVASINVVDPLNPRLIDVRRDPGRGRLRVYGDTLFARGETYTLTISRLKGTESVGTVGGTTTERDASRKHAGKTPGPVRHPKGGEAGPLTYEVTWSGARRPGRGYYPTYEVAYRGVYDAVWLKDRVDVLGGRGQHVISGLQPNMFYQVRVRTVVEEGEFSPWSKHHEFLTPSPGPSWAPEWKTGVTGTEFTLHWTVPEEARTGFVAFLIFLRPQDGQWMIHEMRDRGVFQATLKGLEPLTVYQVRVQGVYGPLNSSPYTTVQALRTGPKAEPPPKKKQTPTPPRKAPEKELPKVEKE